MNIKDLTKVMKLHDVIEYNSLTLSICHGVAILKDDMGILVLKTEDADELFDFCEDLLQPPKEFCFYKVEA